MPRGYVVCRSAQSRLLTMHKCDHNTDIDRRSHTLTPFYFSGMELNLGYSVFVCDQNYLSGACRVRVACHLHVLQFEYEVKYTKEAIVPTRLSHIYMSPKIMGTFWLCLFLCMCLARTQIPPIRAP